MDWAGSGSGWSAGRLPARPVSHATRWDSGSVRKAGRHAISSRTRGLFPAPGRAACKLACGARPGRSGSHPDVPAPAAWLRQPAAAVLLDAMAHVVPVRREYPCPVGAEEPAAVLHLPGDVLHSQIAHRHAWRHRGRRLAYPVSADRMGVATRPDALRAGDLHCLAHAMVLCRPAPASGQAALSAARPAARARTASEIQLRGVCACPAGGQPAGAGTPPGGVEQQSLDSACNADALPGTAWAVAARSSGSCNRLHRRKNAGQGRGLSR